MGNTATLLVRLLLAVGLPTLLTLPVVRADENPAPLTKLSEQYRTDARPVLERYCLTCHSAKTKKGDLDLERFRTIEAARGDLKPWEPMIEMLESGAMPPPKKPQPTAEERGRLLGWVREFLAFEARARSGDPGPTGLRRLSNAEYDATIRDLTGVDLKPTREFPADGAAGEGFTNAAEALGMSPTLLGKYLKAAKDIAAHAVLLPDGIRFSSTSTRRDWTDESVASLRRFYAKYTGEDGRLPLKPYVSSMLRHRDELEAGKLTIESLARAENLSAKYLSTLYKALTTDGELAPLGRLRSRWRHASADDVGLLVDEVSAWQDALWRFQPIGSYRYGNVVRQVANEPSLVESLTLKANPKAEPGETDVVLYLVAQELTNSDEPGSVVWKRPRFERKDGPPRLLRDYAKFGPQYEIDYRDVFHDTDRYLSVAIEAASNPDRPISELAARHELDPICLQRWFDIVALEPFAKEANRSAVEKPIPLVPLELLSDPLPKKPAVNGWKARGADLPVLIANSSDQAELVPGRVSPHHVAAHPTPSEFVAVAWKSPIEAEVQITCKVAHAHPACGNGVAWWLGTRKGDKAFVLADGSLDLGKETTPPLRKTKVAPGDVVLLAVDAREKNHVCDLTEIALTISESGDPHRTWDLAKDIADRVGDGNPHADGLGNRDVWSFVKGPSRTSSSSSIPADSILGRWREAASDPQKQDTAKEIASKVRALLVGPRPKDEKHPDRKLYDSIVSMDGLFMRGLDLAHVRKTPSPAGKYGLDKARFGNATGAEAADESDLILPCNQVVELRLPAPLLRDFEFVVDGKRTHASQLGIVQFVLSSTLPPREPRWDGKSALVAAAEGAARTRWLAGLAEYRRLFPPFVCFPHVIPTDEVVCLKSFHREDEPLIRLFLDDAETRHINRLWEEHRFISRFPVVENEYLPLFIGFVTQDQPKELLAYFESQREPFKRRADEFEKEFEAAAPRQFEALHEFCARAYRRPLSESERQELRRLYDAMRRNKVSHEDTFRGVLERILVSPSYLYHIEAAPPGTAPGPLNDWELAARLSYFLWSSVPDEPLRQAAAAGRLHDPAELAAQTRRMLKDDRVRNLAIEFGTQWIHVRGFDELKEKNECLFPMFDETLRRAIYEESIRFFQDLFQSDRAVTEILDADYTFLNEALAKHYGIPGVTGSEWRRVHGIKKYGRGGILGLASVLTTQAGASRTSPVLRGNWVVETVLGEKLPRPPANVPRLPEEEGGTDGLTMRQLVLKHTSVAECAVCHQRIDPFGFALEKYDPIGRLREKELGGLPLDSRSTLRDGTEFEGIDGLRNYLLTKKRTVFTRLFCRRLLGYALGREVTLSDQPLIDAMVAAVNDGKAPVSSLVQAIVASPQFRLIRGSAFVENE